MHRFPRIQLQEEADASHQAGKQNGEQIAPRTEKKRKKRKKRKKPPLAARAEAKSFLLLRDSAHELCTPTLRTGFSSNSSHGTSNGTPTRTKKGSPLYSCPPPSPAPGVTHALVIHPPLNHGWEGVIDVTAGFFFLFTEEGEGRLHCSLPNY